MKKKFVFILVGLIILLIISFILDGVFVEKTSRFNTSVAMFFVSIFCLVASKQAQKPSEDFGPRNTLKRLYEIRGKLKKYSKLVKTLFIVFVGLGGISLIIGFVEVVISIWTK